LIYYDDENKNYKFINLLHRVVPFGKLEFWAPSVGSQTTIAINLTVCESLWN